MVFIRKPFFSILLAALLSSCVQAAPQPSSLKHSTTHHFHQKRDTTLVSYHPSSTFKTFETPIEIRSLVRRSIPGDKMDHLHNLAYSYLSAEGVNLEHVVWSSGAFSDNTRVAYLKQSINGIPVANAVASIAFDANDNVVTFSSSFVNVDSARIASSEPTFAWKSIVADLEGKLDSSLLNDDAILQYFSKDDGSMALVYSVQLRNQEHGSWYEAHIDAHTGEILSINDFASDASYTVVPIRRKSVAEGLETVIDPADTFASPQAWHSFDLPVAATAGNNVRVYLAGSDTMANQTSPAAQFNYQYNPLKDPVGSSTNRNAALVNAFYVANMVHDVAYRYGFTEEKFNFQAQNFGKGGVENDPVILSIHENHYINLSGKFMTPPDGTSAVGMIYLWDKTQPRRDGAMQNDILIHELAHGITNRLTGGGSARCLQTTIAAGLGEGWSDMFANWFQQDGPVPTDFSIGEYVMNRPKGIRRFPYSTNQSLNPLWYRHVARYTEPHDIGEVWGVMLHELYSRLVHEFGHSYRKLNSPDELAGNTVFMRLLMDALSLQPCNPTFTTARDALFAADRARYNGKHRCIIGRAFASRGLGVNADDSFVDNLDLPRGC
ncbi:hypothetical protein CVT24_012208 [Panaeolus cyanescens]|uniref:Extracellular metalloproteinase n=1 Tax=Panaeolus cyanescens TaxID=181874 RepID=A0A409YIX3_9AGAR|nr:hypothetical protein CVT24_012208 [Panaeolus cyanescens]